MIESWVVWIAIGGYASVLVELVAFPVPSEASTRRLLAPRGAGHELAPALQRARSGRWPRKVVCYAVPTALGVVLFLLPPVAMLVPAVADLLAPLPGHPALRAAGAALIVGGRAVTFAGVIALRAARGARLTASGPFACTRNPVIVGMHALHLGAIAIVPSPWLIALLVVHAFDMHRRARLEEAQLRHRHGDAYAEYARRVPRYVGLVRARA